MNCGTATSHGVRGRCPRCNHGNRSALTTTQRGYGHAHQKRRAALLAAAYGQPCPICGKLTLHGQALDLDHTTRLVDNPNSIGDRITHATCNRRGGHSSIEGDRRRA